MRAFSRASKKLQQDQQVHDQEGAVDPSPGNIGTLRPDRVELVSILTIVMDTLNTHTGASLYTACPPETARVLREKLELVYTPKHGSWLTMAECEFRVLSRHCVNRRLPDRATVKKKVDAQAKARNREAVTAESRCTADDARIKLESFYPSSS